MKNKELLIYKGLYGDNTNLQWSNFIQYESLEKRSKIYDWEIKEHLHPELYQIFIIQSGHGSLISENRAVTLTSPCVITVPTDILHGFYFNSNIEGGVLTFSESFLENIFKHSPNILHEFSQLRQIPFQQDADWGLITSLNDLIAKELIEENLERHLYVQSLFQLFFVHLFRIAKTHQTQVEQSTNRTLQYFQIFQKSIKKTITETKSIDEYAKEIGITSVHLNRVCRMVVQKSALGVIQDYLISEAKKYLLNTTYSISEISYFLNFKDPAYFTRLFKKNTGVSPSDFRKN
jgi:AraC family transcriptional regulator, transcriptional activator of pobA